MQREEAQAGPRRLRLMLSPDVDAPAATRRALRSLPLGPRADDVLLLASELVTNAVVQDARAPGDPIELSAACERGRTRVEVCDPGGRVADELCGGYGLRMLAVAGDRWGIEHDGATRVWFELDQ
jgi:hypothetical protein